MIKYKIWDKKNKCWYKPTYRAYEGKLEELLIGLDGRLAMRTLTDFIDESAFPDRFEIVPSIGLKDKDGNEIYKGDIVTVVGNIYENP